MNRHYDWQLEGEREAWEASRSARRRARRERLRQLIKRILRLG